MRLEYYRVAKVGNVENVFVKCARAALGSVRENLEAAASVGRKTYLLSRVGIDDPNCEVVMLLLKEGDQPHELIDNNNRYLVLVMLGDATFVDDNIDCIVTVNSTPISE